MELDDLSIEERDLLVNEPSIYDKNHKGYFTISNHRPMIKDLAENERPMEKLCFRGSEALSDVELLAILIGSGTRKTSALDLAYQVLSKFGNHENMMEVTVEELQTIKGIGTSKASKIVAGLELGKRIRGRKSIRTYRIGSPEEVYDLYEERFRYENVEHFFVILLDTKNQIIGEVTVSIGDLNKTIVNPREVFKIAIKRSSNSIMLVHNHPSGDPRPSKDDIAITKRLIECGDLLGIKVLDHIIIGYNEFYSMKRENII